MGGDPRGSLWRRWDPHIHAPGTILNDQFGGQGSLDEYLARIETATPTIEALGVTDYWTTSCYEAVIAAQRDSGRLPGVRLVFPNVEMRLSIGTTKNRGINVHLLVSPDDPDHLEQITRFLSRLTFEYKNDKFSCTQGDLVRLGKTHVPSVEDDAAALTAGATQFKVDFKQLRSEFDASDWIQSNSLIAVVGSSTDGTSGLQSTDSGFAALRKEIERFAHVVFSGEEKQSEFWSGTGKASRDHLDAEYGGPKPCLHGSDAHGLTGVGSPDLNRFTWLKGDPIFETLRQTCLEPRSRVHIGELPPELQSPERTITNVSTTGAPWLLDEGLDLNPGLVAVIGSRGSGKTALADVIAHAAGSQLPSEGQDSFLTRARSLLDDVAVKITWSDGGTSQAKIPSVPLDEEPGVHYLSQQFVERLCSADSASDELIDEVQKVVFAAHPPSTRLEATTFAELLDERLGDTRRRRTYLQDQLDRVAEDSLLERSRLASVTAKRKALASLQNKLKSDNKMRSGIVSKGEKARAEYYERLNSEISERERTIQALRKREQQLTHLMNEVTRHTRSVFPSIVKQLRDQFGGLGLSAEDWEAFTVTFAGSPEELLLKLQSGAAKQIANFERAESGSTPTIASGAAQLQQVGLQLLKQEIGKVADLIGIDKQNAQRLKGLNSRIAAAELEVEKAAREIELFEGARDRLDRLFSERSQAYEELFELIVAEEVTLAKLYGPLAAKLGDAGATVGNLRLAVVRRIDVSSWAARGEDLLDLRKGGKLKGRGTLEEFARETLAPAWRTGSAADVARAMIEFREKYDQDIIAQSKVEKDSPDYVRWTVEIGRWLYSTDHVDVTYDFEFEDLPLSQLSPGMRGIVLLLLYLALDMDDHRPLLIDQPEENLDPRSVFAELVALFRNARTRRQVIIVTHNANLVVNTDVDQVIVASCTRSGSKPMFTYRSGGLEDAAIRAEVCEILEGGEAAFRERARRLRVGRFRYGL